MLGSPDKRFPRSGGGLATINAIDKILPSVPHVICRWHFKKDVPAYARELKGIWGSIHSPTPEEPGRRPDSNKTCQLRVIIWNAICSNSVEEFERLHLEINDDYPQVQVYLEREWWINEGRLGDYYINEYRHFCEISFLLEQADRAEYFRSLRLETKEAILVSRHGSRDPVRTFIPFCEDVFTGRLRRTRVSPEKSLQPR